MKTFSCKHTRLKSLAALALAIIFHTAFGQEATLTYNGSGNYTYVERTNLRRYDNGKYVGLVNREVRSFIARTSVPAGGNPTDSYYDGIFFVDEATKRNYEQVRGSVNGAIPSSFKISSTGQLTMLTDFGYPSFRSFPAFPSQKIRVGDKWQAKAERTVDPLNKGVFTKMPILVEYTYLKDDVFEGEDVYVFSAEWATRYGISYQDYGGDKELKTAQGSHKATMYVSKRTGSALVVRDQVDETFTYADGGSYSFKGTISMFTEYPPAYDKRKLYPALQRVAGVTAEELERILESPKEGGAGGAGGSSGASVSGAPGGKASASGGKKSATGSPPAGSVTGAGIKEKASHSPAKVTSNATQKEVALAGDAKVAGNTSLAQTNADDAAKATGGDSLTEAGALASSPKPTPTADVTKEKSGGIDAAQSSTGSSLQASSGQSGGAQPSQGTGSTKEASVASTKGKSKTSKADIEKKIASAQSTQKQGSAASGANVGKASTSPAPAKDSGSDKKVTVESTQAGIRLTMQNLNFKPDSAELLLGERERLDQIAAVLKEVPDQMFLVEGHTASVGKVAGEMQLSIERANAIAKALVERGIPRERFICKGLGGTKPIASNDSAQGKARNRRVEITILE